MKTKKPKPYWVYPVQTLYRLGLRAPYVAVYDDAWISGQLNDPDTGDAGPSGGKYCTVRTAVEF